MTKHYETSLQRDIEFIKTKVEEMSSLAQKSLARSLEALITNNRQLAYSVILRDQRIDELEKEIDRLCLEFLVRQQPVATPLRLAYVTIKINQELERIGDYSESIARQVIKLSALNIELPKERYIEIAEASIQMLKDATNAFLNQDLPLARKTMEVEEKVDLLRSAINKEIFQLRVENKIPMEAFTPMATVARRFERVSDQAKNICEETQYLVTGEYAKHLGTDVYRVLFMDDANVTLSQMAEGLGNSLGLTKLVFASAGIQTGVIQGDLQRFMSGKGIDISRQYSKGLGQVPNLEYYSVGIAFSKDALKQLAALPPKSVKLDWTFPDPSQSADLHGGFEAAFEYLQKNLKDLTEAILGNDEKK